MKRPFRWLRNGEFFKYYGLLYMKTDQCCAYCFDRVHTRTMSDESMIWPCNFCLFDRTDGTLIRV